MVSTMKIPSAKAPVAKGRIREAVVILDGKA